MLEELLRSFKYLALMTGTFVEGETAILLASIMIYRGLFFLPYTVFFGFLGSFISDWVYYLIGRMNGKRFVERRPALAQRAAHVTLFFQKHRTQILFSYRFLYGFRVIIPLVIGMSGLSPRQFLFYSIAAGISWATIVTCIGYAIGAFFEVDGDDIRNNILFVVLACAGVGLMVGYFARKVLWKEDHGNVVPGNLDAPKEEL
jgi:membrane protein DedA with SNARE-associated domain